MAVKVTVDPQTNVMELVSETTADKAVEAFLIKAVNDYRATGSVSKAKAALGGTVLKMRELQAEKMELLLKSAETWEDKSRDWSTSVEIRQLNADRARRARVEAGRIAQELGE